MNEYEYLEEKKRKKKLGFLLIGSTVALAASATGLTLALVIDKEDEAEAFKPSFDKALPSGPIYATSVAGEYTTNKTKAKGYVAPQAGTQKALPVTPVAGTTIVVDGQIVTYKAGTPAFAGMPSGDKYPIAAPSGTPSGTATYTTDKTKATGYVKPVTEVKPTMAGIPLTTGTAVGGEAADDANG